MCCHLANVSTTEMCEDHHLVPSPWLRSGQSCARLQLSFHTTCDNVQRARSLCLAWGTSPRRRSPHSLVPRVRACGTLHHFRTACLSACSQTCKSTIRLPKRLLRQSWEPAGR